MRWLVLLLAFLWVQPTQAASLSRIAARLKAECGAKIVSTYRQTRIAGTRVMSCHAYGQAFDVTGNYACIYRVLRSWPGGYTVDAGRCRHVHVSSCAREWGLRFRHRSC